MQGNRKTGGVPEERASAAADLNAVPVVRNPTVEVGGKTFTPDFLVRGTYTAIFIDGCFWHEIARNGARDRLLDAQLTRHGWRPIRIWEHEDPGHVFAALAAELTRQP
jgi:G:T-mismatch repair DNA endonuclease (very short patch repair protein)